MKTCPLATCIMSLSMACLSAAGNVKTLFDFADPRYEFHLVEGNYLSEADAATQMTREQDGLHLRLDAAKMRPKPNWCTLTIDPKIHHLHEWQNQVFRLVMRAHPFRRVTRGMAINFQDKDGEIFQFLPDKVQIDEVDNLLICTFTVSQHTVAGAPWGGGDKANGKMDLPLAFTSLNCHYASREGRGEAVLVRFECVEAAPEVLRKVCSREPISVDTTYPGAKPFPGPDSLHFRITPEFRGMATLTLSTNSQAAANEGEMVSFTANANQGELVFDCKLPYMQQYQYYRMQFKPAANSPVDNALVLDAYGVFYQTAAEALRLDIDTGNPLHIVRAEKASERPVVTIANPSEQAMHWRMVLKFSDVFRRQFEVPFDRTVAAGECVRVPVPWPLPAKGLWFVNAEVVDDNNLKAVVETRFAYLDLHERTPYVGKPKFRCGIHYHGTHYLPNLVDLTIEAMVAAGAKFTRTDYSFMFGDIMREPGKYDWGKADDLLKRLKDAGLAVDIIISGTPRWAVAPEILEERKGRRRPGCLPPRPGLFKTFCEEFAKRYGKEIDYFEVGNEWDIVPKLTLRPEEALRMQREAYEGIHAVCPQAFVTTNGWAGASSENLDNDERDNKGLIEEFARHPELYDAWMIHCHGLFESYVQRIQEQFLKLREATPMKTRPWISNESALTSHLGNEFEVARTVWAKILYAWSWGSRDYIWYNLRATGWLEGHEPGYGLITAGFYPRAGYAAFSALTAIFQGLDFDARLYSQDMKHLARFKGDGKLVLAGWNWRDEPYEKTWKVIVRTDAKQAWLADHMNNRQAVPVHDGQAVFELGYLPQALILDNATFAEVKE